MSRTTENTVIASGIAYVISVGKSQENLWLFGRDMVTLMENTEKELREGMREVVAKAIAKKTDRSVKTIQNRMSSAIKCYKTFAEASDASYFSMRELNGQKKKDAPKGRRTEAVKALEAKVNALTDAEFAALVASRKASKKN